MRAAALSMARRIRHRGPDGQAAWASPSGLCALGHARLRVIDLETGDQPMANEDGTVQVVFNGEIYNFRELRAELEGAGHRFRTRSDTEVLVHGWEAWGRALPERLDGMFAFGLWDERARTLLLARDRAGKKPLFWTRVGERLAFASEIKALHALEWTPRGIRPEAFPLYLAYGYVPEPHTFYRGIEKLPPASAMLVRSEGSARGRGVASTRRASERAVASSRGAPAGGLPPAGANRADALTLDTFRYWRLDWTPAPAGIGVREASSRVRDLLRTAVERRLVADVPLGAFLSGGIDSTLVVGLMRELIEGPIRTFSLGFADDPTYDETSFARLAARRFATEHTEFVVEAGALERLDALVEAYDEPFGDSSAIPTHIISEMTREHVAVALTGDGGDEMFAGYPRFMGAVLAERTPRALMRLGNAVGRRLPHHPDFRHPARRFSRFFAAASLPPDERTLHWIGYLPDPERFLRPELRGFVTRDALLESFRVPLRRAAALSPLARTLALNFETYLPEDLLVKADRCSMAHGLELRSPFLDTALMEFAAALPDGLRIRRGALKWLLRRAFTDVLPREITRRGKMGFGVPLPIWFRTRWKGLFEYRVLSSDARIRDWLMPEPLAALWAEHQSGRADHGHALWALLTLETWLRRMAR